MPQISHFLHLCVLVWLDQSCTHTWMFALKKLQLSKPSTSMSVVSLLHLCHRRRLVGKWSIFRQKLLQVLYRNKDQMASARPFSRANLNWANDVFCWRAKFWDGGNEFISPVDFAGRNNIIIRNEDQLCGVALNEIHRDIVVAKLAKKCYQIQTSSVRECCIMS